MYPSNRREDHPDYDWRENYPEKGAPEFEPDNHEDHPDYDPRRGGFSNEEGE